MRQLRNALFFLLGVLLVGVPMLVLAETQPATLSDVWYDNPNGIGQSYPTAEQYAQAFLDLKANKYLPNWVPAPITCNVAGPAAKTCILRVQDAGGGPYYQTIDQPTFHLVQAYACPSSGGWTLQGQTCTRADCPSGQTRDPVTGQCGTSCPQQDLGTGWYRSAPGVDLSGTYCTGGCEVTLSLSLSTGESYSSSSAIWTPLSKWRNGNTCTVPKDLPSSSPQPPNAPPKNPPCTPGDGVIALNSGGVYCVPKAPGVDDPKVSKEQKTQTFPDGSTSTTITTNTCTGHGACTSTTTITNTPGAGGGQGQAGPVGTSTGKTDKPVTDQPDFCKANPNLQICKGNIAEEATQKKILEGLETITKPTITDDSSLTEKGEFKPSDDLKTENDRAKDRADGSIDPISAPKGAWESAMISGFWSPIPQFGCSPHSSKIGPFQWSFDPCPIASRISEIGAYALWFILAISTFVMLTGGRKS